MSVIKNAIAYTAGFNMGVVIDFIIIMAIPFATVATLSTGGLIGLVLGLVGIAILFGLLGLALMKCCLPSKQDKGNQPFSSNKSSFMTTANLGNELGYTEVNSNVSAPDLAPEGTQSSSRGTDLT